MIKHDEKKITEIFEVLSDSMFEFGTGHGRKDEEFIKKGIKQYAEHMMQQERERILKQIISHPTFYSDNIDRGDALHYPTYKSIINLINKKV